MLKNYLYDTVIQSFPFEPTEQQGELIRLLGDFLTDISDNKVFLLKGYAGTGKTSVVSALVRSCINCNKNYSAGTNRSGC